MLELALRRGFIEPDVHARFKADLEEIAKMVSGLINALEERQRQ